MDASDLTLTVTPRRRELLAGEELWVQVELRNEGQQAVQVTHPRSPAGRPVSYTMEPVGSSQPAVKISQAAYRRRRAGGDVLPRLRSITATLEPGEALGFADDIAKYSDGALEPGDYRLVARHTELPLASDPVELRLVLPSIQSMSALLCPLRQQLAAAFDHTNNDGTVALYQKDTIGAGPDTGTFRRRQQLPAGVQLDGVAVACMAEDFGEGRWIAWLHHGLLGAARGAGTAVTSGQLAPCQLDVASPVLARPGFQLAGADGSGLFWVVGQLGPDAAVQQVSLNRGQVVMAAPVPLYAGQPARAVAHCDHVGGYWATHVVWIDDQSQAAWAVSLDPDGGALGGAEEVFGRHRGPALCLELFPLGPAGEAQVHLLFGPSPDDGRTMTYVRAPLIPGQVPLEEWTFPAPDQPAEAWAVANVGSQESLPVVAKAGDALLWTRAITHDQWQVLDQGLPPIGNLHLLVSVKREHWVVWTDPLAGVRHARLPVSR